MLCWIKLNIVPKLKSLLNDDWRIKMYVLRIIYPQKKKTQKNSTTRMFSNQFPQSAHFLESQGRMVQGYHGSQVSPRYVFHLIGNSLLWRAVPTLYSEWCPWLGTVPSKMPPNDPHILLFTSLCNPLPMNVDGICYLFLIKKNIGKVMGCHFHNYVTNDCDFCLATDSIY